MTFDRSLTARERLHWIARWRRGCRDGRLGIPVAHDSLSGGHDRLERDACMPSSSLLYTSVACSHFSSSSTNACRRCASGNHYGLRGTGERIDNVEGETTPRERE